MKISRGTRIWDQSESNGYGYATVNMYASLERLGYEVNPNDETADVEIWFDQPHHWRWSKNVYRIGYHPWESTALLPRQGWEESMNQCDEIWTPSLLIADWYKTYMNIKPPVYVYEHGVEPIWTPKKRKIKGTFRFLHVGGQAARKGAVESMRALRYAFPRDVDVEITMKILTEGWNFGKLPRINVLNDIHSLQELVQLFHDHHAYVYPSYGEGFGLTPLQAMATGMPTITLPAWAPYSRFLDPNLSVGSKLTKSPWQKIHPGKMFTPNLDDVVDGMRYAYQNYDEAQTFAMQQTKKIFEYYDWDRLTAEAFGDLEKRLKI